MLLRLHLPEEGSLDFNKILVQYDYSKELMVKDSNKLIIAFTLNSEPMGLHSIIGLSCSDYLLDRVIDRVMWYLVLRDCVSLVLLMLKNETFTYTLCARLHKARTGCQFLMYSEKFMFCKVTEAACIFQIDSLFSLLSNPSI